MLGGAQCLALKDEKGFKGEKWGDSSQLSPKYVTAGVGAGTVLPWGSPGWALEDSCHTLCP